MAFQGAIMISAEDSIAVCLEDFSEGAEIEVRLGEASGLYEGVGGIAAPASSPTKSETPPGSAEDNIDRIWNGYGTESGLPDYDYLSGGWRTNAEEDE